MQKVSFIVHGKIRRKQKLKDQITAALSSQFKLIFLETQDAGDAMKLAEHAVNEGTDYLIAVGGDGLLNEVANGYMHAGKSQREQVIVGTFPFGTGNDFAKSVKITSDFEQIAGLIKSGTSKPIDIGYMEYINTDRAPASRYYVNIADIGIGGYTSKRVNESSKLLGADLTYMKAIVMSFLTYKHRKVKLTAGDFSWQGPILVICMANGKYFGSGMGIAPQAEVDDGMMQLVILGNVTLLDYVKNLSKVKQCEIIEHPEVQYLKVASCEIDTLEECTIDMDGEFIGYGPISAKMLKHEMLFLRE